MARRRQALIALLACAMLTLGGCVRVHSEAVIHEDDTVDASMVVALDSRVADSVGEEQAEELWEMVNAELAQELPPDAEVTRYDQEGFTGSRYSYEELSLEDFSTLDWQIRREGDEFVIEGEVELASQLGDLGIPSPGRLPVIGDWVDVDMRLAFTFPGEVIEHNADSLEGTTVAWEPEFGGTTEMYARASADPRTSPEYDGPSTLTLALLWGGGALLALLLLAGVVALVMRRRRRGPAAPMAGTPAPGAAVYASTTPPPGPPPGAPAFEPKPADPANPYGMPPRDQPPQAAYGGGSLYGPSPAGAPPVGPPQHGAPPQDGAPPPPGAPPQGGSTPPGHGPHPSPPRGEQGYWGQQGTP